MLLLEHTLAHLDRLTVLLQREVQCLRASRGHREDEEYRGLYVSDDDVDELTCELPHTPDRTGDDQAFAAALTTADQRLERIVAECRDAEEEPRLDRLARLFCLSRQETDVVLVALAAEVDLKYERLFAYLQ